MPPSPQGAGALIVVTLAAVGTAALPPPPATPPAVPSTTAFAAGSWFEERHEERLYPQLREWPAAGTTEWQLKAGSTAWLQCSLDGEPVRLPLTLTGRLTMDAAAPQQAGGSLRAMPAPAIATALGPAWSPLVLTPTFEAMGSVPRAERRSAAGPWGWSVGELPSEGRVLMKRDGPDRLRLQGLGWLEVDLSAPRWEGLRDALAAALGGRVISEQIALGLDLHLAR